MTFATVEASTQDGRPIELYNFVTSNGVGFRFTNGEDQITDDQFLVYTPAPIARTQPVQSTEKKATQITVSMNLEDGASDEFTQTFISNPVEGTLSLTIKRVHLSDSGMEFVQFWEGRVVSTAYTEDQVLEMLCKGVKNIFLREGPRMTWGSSCQHTLYDANCALDELSFTVSNVTVDAIGADGVTITLNAADLGTPPDLIGGKVIKDNGLDKRLIVAQAANVITIQQPFRSDFVAGAEVDVTQGCDHTITDCRDQFNNVINYGGSPFTPGLNPFAEGLDRL